MKTRLFVVAGLLCSLSGAIAVRAESPDSSNIEVGPSIVETAPSIAMEPREIVVMSSRSPRGKLWAAAAALTAATILDGETTFVALRRCDTCREGNPVMRPLVEGGSLRFYAAQMTLNAGALYISSRLLRSHDESFRGVWLRPSLALMGMHTFAGALNLRW